MPTTRWQNLKHKLSPEQRADVSVREELAEMDRRRGEPTDEVCDVCRAPLCYGDQAVTNRQGRTMHVACSVEP